MFTVKLPNRRDCSISVSFLSSLWAESYSSYELPEMLNNSLCSHFPPTAYFSRDVKLPALCWEDLDLWPGRSAAAGPRAAQHSRGNRLDERSQRRTRGGRGSRLDAVQPQHSCWLQGKKCLVFSCVFWLAKFLTSLSADFNLVFKCLIYCSCRSGFICRRIKPLKHFYYWNSFEWWCSLSRGVHCLSAF